MKSFLLNNAKSFLGLVFLTSFLAFSATAQDFSPEVSFAIDNSMMGEASNISIEILQEDGEADIANITITTDGGSFDFSNLSVGTVVGTGSGYISGGSNSGAFNLVASAVMETSADLEVVNQENEEVLGMMFISNNTDNGVQIYSSNTYDDGNNTTAGNLQQLEISGLFSNPMTEELNFSSIIFSEINPNGPSSDASASIALMADVFSPDVQVTFSNQSASALTDITFSVSQDSGEEDIDNITFTFDGGSFDLASLSLGDIVGSGSGSFGGNYASGSYTIVVSQINATTAIFNAVDNESLEIIASFSVINYPDGGAAITSSSPGDDNTTTAGNSNTFTLSNIFINPNADVIGMTSVLVSELESSQSETIEVSLEGATDFSPALSVSFGSNECNAASTLAFTISQDAGEVDMASAIITMTGGSFDFSNSSVGDLVGTGSGFYGGNNDFTLSLYILEITADGAVIIAVDDSNQDQNSTFTITNLAEGVQITVSSPGDNNSETQGNSTSVTISAGFVNGDEGNYNYYGSFTSESNDLDGFDGQYVVVCPCEDVLVSEDVTLCPGESYTVGDNTYTEAGVYENVFTLETGCDSIITTTLAFYDVLTPTISGETNAFENTSYDYTVDAQNESTLQWGVVNGDINSGQGTASVNITWGDGPSTGTVWLIETDANGCKSDTAFLEVTINEVVGITENALLAVNVYPNPFTEFTTVQFSNPDNDTYRIALMDASGRLVLNSTTQANQFVIKKENLNEGIYFLEIDGKYKSRQIIVIQ